jgi:hypothetical protein
MNARRTIPLLLLAAAAVLLAGCAALDVVGRTAISTFQALLEAEPGSVTRSGTPDRWVFTSPGGERFEWSLDFSSAGPDFLLSFDAAPFLAAGLETAELPADRYAFDAASGTLALSFEAGGKELRHRGTATPLETFRAIVGAYRPMIGYHAALDHYGIALGGGNMFEWAKDLSTNDKDIVFVLDPGPFIAAGVDPGRIEGWVFAKVPVMDASGKPVEVDKILKPYDLED